MLEFWFFRSCTFNKFMLFSKSAIFIVDIRFSLGSSAVRDVFI